MIVLLWVANFVISWVNAWGCGKTWNETRSVGGAAHFMNWMGAIMSASGFTWCYTLLGGFVGTLVHHKNDAGVSVPYLSPEAFQAMMSLGYLVVILPILGSGLAIMLHSWGVFWRRRTFVDGAVAGYNTFAEVHNIYSAATHIPGAVRNVGGFFGGSSSSSDDDGPVGLLVLAALIGGILTTRAIIRSTARSTASTRYLRYAER